MLNNIIFAVGKRQQPSTYKNTIMKKIFTFLIGLSLWTLTATAQEPVAETTSPVATETDSLQRVVDDLSQQLRHQKNKELDRKIWKDRSKYFNLGYVKQSLIFKDSGDEKLKNDFGVSISWGKTYYLHKKPLFGMMKFGLDWSWVDLNYSKYTISESEEPGSDPVGDIMDRTIDIGNHQLEYGMQFGPSITINPVHQLKISLYFRLTPSYSMMYLDDSFNSNFALFYSFGGSVAWKVISVGVEGRWGQAKYKGFSLGDIDFDGENVDISSTKTKLKTSSVRFYIGFRF